jgi:hypothetical protein
VTILDFIGVLYKVHKIKGSWGSNLRSLSCFSVKVKERKIKLSYTKRKKSQFVPFLDKRRVEVAAVGVARP